MTKYRIIYADPAWQYGSKQLYGDRQKGVTERKRFKPLPYPTCSLDFLKSMDIKSIIESDAACFLWVTDSHLKQGIEVIESWGFNYKTIAFVWLKKTTKGKIATNLAPYTLKSTEICLLGVRGAIGKYKCFNGRGDVVNITSSFIEERGKNGCHSFRVFRGVKVDNINVSPDLIRCTSSGYEYLENGRAYDKNPHPLDHLRPLPPTSEWSRNKKNNEKKAAKIVAQLFFRFSLTFLRKSREFALPYFFFIFFSLTFVPQNHFLKKSTKKITMTMQFANVNVLNLPTFADFSTLSNKSEQAVKSAFMRLYKGSKPYSKSNQMTPFEVVYFCHIMDVSPKQEWHLEAYDMFKTIEPQDAEKIVEFQMQQLNSLNQKLSEATKQTSLLQSEVNDLLTNNKQLLQQAKDVEAKDKALTDSLKKNDTLQQTNNELTIRVATLEKKVTDVSDKITTAQSENEQLKSLNKNLVADLDHTKRLLKTSQANEEVLTQSVRKLNQQFSEINEKVVKNGQKAVETESSKNELAIKNAELSQRNNQLVSSNKELGEKVGELQTQRSELQKQVGELDKKNSELQKQIGELQTQRSELEKRVGELDKKNNELQRTDANLTNLLEKVERLNGEIAETEKVKAEIKTKYEAATLEIVNLNTKIVEIKGDNKALSDKNWAFQSDLRAAKQELTNTINEASAMETSLRQEIEQMKSTLSFSVRNMGNWLIQNNVELTIVNLLACVASVFGLVSAFGYTLGSFAGILLFGVYIAILRRLNSKTFAASAELGLFVMIVFELIFGVVHYNTFETMKNTFKVINENAPLYISLLITALSIIAALLTYAQNHNRSDE